MDKNHIIDQLDQYILSKKGVKKVLFKTINMYRFPNGWIYINHGYKNYVIIGFGKGNKMIKSNPLLYSCFDEVRVAVAKIKISNVEQIASKSICTLIDYSFDFNYK